MDFRTGPLKQPDSQKISETTLIIGNQSEHSKAFTHLALGDYRNVVVASPTSHRLTEWPNWHLDGRPNTIDMDFWTEDLAAQVHTEAHAKAYSFYEKLPITLLVNLVEFKNVDPWADWESLDQSISIDVPQMVDVTKLFYKDMVSHGKGEILNVIRCPADCNEVTREMFQSTQALLMEIANSLNEDSPTDQVRVHTLAYSPQSLSIQTDALPADIAHDMVPDLCSAEDIAKYGYQILKVGRGEASK